MTVTRTTPGGETCSYARCWTIDVDCSLLFTDDAQAFRGSSFCAGSTVENEGFAFNAEEGGMADDGAAEAWNYSAGNPEVVLDLGMLDSNFVRLRGNGGYSDLLYQGGLGLHAGDSIRLRMAFRPFPGLVLPGTELVVRLSSSSQDSLFCQSDSTCVEIIRTPIPALDSLTWLIGGGYELLVFDANYLTVHIENPFFADDIGQKSVTDVDNICIDMLNFVSTEEKASLSGVQVYPNPTSGLLNIRLEKPLNEVAKLSILNVQGRLLREQQLEKGQSFHTLQLNALPAGIYIVRLVTSDGANWHGKIVKE